jgi:hypothetical protein
VIHAYEPTNTELIRMWEGGLDTAAMARVLKRPEGKIAGQLWRAREAKKDRLLAALDRVHGRREA